MAADGAGGGADGGRAEDGRREDDTYRRARGGAPPGAVAGGGLVLVFVDLAVGVLGDHGSVVGADQAAGVQILDDLVVILRSGFVRVRCDENERAVGVGHGALLVFVAGCWTFSYSLGQRLAPFIARFAVSAACCRVAGAAERSSRGFRLLAARERVTEDPDPEGVDRVSTTSPIAAIVIVLSSGTCRGEAGARQHGRSRRWDRSPLLFLAESSPLIASPSGICRYLTVTPVVSARLRMSLRPRPGTFHRPERREEASSMLDEAALSGARDGVAAAATPWPGPDSSVSWTADRWLLSLHLGDGTGTGPRCNGCPWRRAQAVWAR